MSFSSGEIRRQLHHFFERSVDCFSSNIALICDNALISYQELECRANQLAHYLQDNQISNGSIVGILLERSVECYVAILAILKAGAAYVPIEVDYPDERINHIFSDLAFDALLTSSTQLAQKTLAWPTVFAIDALSEEISRQPTKRLIHTAQDADALCYVIYTSGSTGKPKGVEILQSSICHYVKEASKLYEMSSDDRMYQGFSLAFDASLEELWMAFANGATLIACTSKEVRSGVGLITFLHQHRVTVFSTVPTLLSTLEGQLPDLRLLILGGETCPASLVRYWSKDSLRIINTYGPTEATIITTYAECHPEKEVTIGKPLSGYEVLILNEQLNPVPDGEEGELYIGGLALARGYVNRPESTAKKFIINPANKNQRLYRTGDLVTRNTNGDLLFVGRVDNQIKLRGFRIELNEIETVITQFSGVRQAVVSLQASEQPMLLAYIVMDKTISVNLNELNEFLRGKLPDYMIPAAFEVLDSFPVLSNGKVNRKELPEPTGFKTEKIYYAPKSELAKEIAHVWEKVFDCAPISTDADFFYDLGGHSLLAAKVISNLRKLPALKTISILDLYKNPTINQLDQKFSIYTHSPIEEEQANKKKYRAPQWNYYLCGVGQFFGCILQYALGTLQLLAVVLCYSWITSKYSIISKESQLAFLGLFLSLPIISLLITVGMKWLLLGRVKPGEYPLWGWFYYRWWLVQRLQKNLFLAKFLVGTPLATLYYRLLGAKIGKNCYLGSVQMATPDLLCIGDNTSIGTDSRLYGYLVEDGWLKIGSINIGSDCYLGPRAVVGLNSVIEDHGILDDMSMLPEQGFIPQDAYFSGSPAVPGPLPVDHITRQNKEENAPAVLENILFGVLHYLGIVFVMIMFYLCFIPCISLVTYYYDQSRYFTTMFFAIPLGAVLFLSMYYLCIILCKKVIMNKIKPGQYPLQSFYYLRHWIIVKMLDSDEISIMADTLMIPAFWRLLGAKLGKGVEMGETPHIIPDLVTINEGGFTASSVALGWPTVCHSKVTFAPVVIGRRGFVGNVSLLVAGKAIGENALLGCLSITPPGDKATEPNSAWLGSPAVYLPKRELFVGFSDKDTFYPSKKLYFTRLVIEFFRIIIPTTFSLIVMFNMLYVLDYMINNFSWFATALVLPVSELFFTLCLIGVLIGLKWVLLGKLKPLTKPIWDPFIWKNDVIEYTYNYYTNPHFTNKVLGTPFALMVQRCLGTKAGKRIFTDTAEFSEFDLITVGDDVCINAETIIQTHLYEDRIFKVSTVTINSGCNVGIGSIVLYNTVMETNSSLGSLSLLMKGEYLPENTNWAGIPAQSTVLRPSYHPASQTAVSGSITEDVIPELSS